MFQKWNESTTAHVFVILTLLQASGCRSSDHALSAPEALSRIKFHPAILNGRISITHVPSCWNDKLRIGSNDENAYEFLTIDTAERPKRIRVETPAQYLRAIERGAYAFTTFDMAMEAWFVRAVGTLQFMERAKPGRRSRSSSDLKRRLAEHLVMEYGSKPQPAKIIPAEPLRIAGREFWIEALARGDVDDDGFEDVLFFVSWRYVEGSGFGYQLYLASRRQDKPTFRQFIP